MRVAQTIADRSPRLSATLHVLPLDGDPDRFLFYAPLRRAAFVGNQATAEAIRTGCGLGGALTDLLGSLEILDAGEEYAPSSRPMGEPEPVSVTLLLTSACNLRCTYCYASAGETAPEFMSIETARRAVGYVAASAARKQVPQIELMFHGGGEPTLNWDVLTGAVDYGRALAAGHGLQLWASVATNAVLPDDRIDWLCANLNTASVSFDGLPSCHDENRLDVMGHGSSERVIHTLRRFDAAGFSYGVRLTVTAGQIQRLADSIDFIYANFGATGILVEPVYQLGRWRDGPSAESAEFIEGFRDAKDRARRFGRPVSFSGARVGLLTDHFCGVSRDSFSVAPSGNITGCYEVFSEGGRWARKFFYGKPDEGSGYRFDLGVLDSLRHLGVVSKPHCEGCFAKWTCGGDCAHKALELNGDGEFSGAGRCHVIRELTKDMILEKIEAAGGVAWHEGGLGPAQGGSTEAPCG